MLDAIKASLQSLRPTHLEVRDDSHKHAGHAGAREHGGSHFALFIVSEAFDGKPLVARHRMVYAALDGAFAPGGIHALQIRALTPAEWKEKQRP
ncbi:MAG: BolA/IbaG family iron-sulfur metabolism protein [Proteobacteria bacterium]|nr:BolA/IbaG family iron-sulfur metabolism protein [Pseudomonadota bacterium]